MSTTTAATGPPSESPSWGELPRPVAFVLSGGSSLGAVHAGMLQATAEAGLTPDLVVGTSVGAVNGSMIAWDPDGAAERLASIWRTVDRPDVFPGGRLRQAWTLLRTRRHLFPSTALARLVRLHVGARWFDELTLPFGTVATDALTGHPVTHTEGRLLRAVIASAAIPGIFPRVHIDGRWYVDGGASANVPMRQAQSLGAASLVVLDVGYPCHRTDLPANVADNLMFATSLLLHHQALGDMPLVSQDLPVIYLPPPCPVSTSPFDFSGSVELMESSYQSAARFLGTVDYEGPGLYGGPHVHPDAVSADLAVAAGVSGPA